MAQSTLCASGKKVRDNNANAIVTFEEVITRIVSTPWKEVKLECKFIPLNQNV